MTQNSSALQRTGSIIVAGQTVTITQSGVDCSYALRADSGSVPYLGGTGSVGLIAPVGCAWTVSSDQSWLSLNTATGSGTSEIYYVAEVNSATTGRTATLTIQGRPYTVTQAGVPCSYTLDSTSSEVGPDGATGTFTYSAQSGCSDKAVSFSNWISVSTGPPGVVSFTVGPNPLISARSGTILVGDKIFTVKQTAAACSFSLNAYGAIFDSEGGSGSVLASASQLGCSPAVGASPELIPYLGPLSQDEISKIWTQPYEVPSYESFNLWIRVLQISISGEIFTVKQTSW
jgi:hypothetical protein